MKACPEKQAILTRLVNQDRESCFAISLLGDRKRTLQTIHRQASKNQLAIVTHDTVSIPGTVTSREVANRYFSLEVIRIILDNPNVRFIDDTPLENKLGENDFQLEMF